MNYFLLLMIHFPLNFEMISLFQIWVCKDDIQQKSETLQNSGWMCHAVGSYKYVPTLN